MSFQNAKIVQLQADPNEYHHQVADRGTSGYSMSSSALREFGRCPQRWKDGYNAPDTDAKELGSLLDCLVLTPASFEARYSVEPKEYGATVMECPNCESQTDSKKCRKCGVDRVEKRIKKEWNNSADACREWASEQKGKEIVSAKHLFEAHEAVRRLSHDEIIKSFIACSDSQVWVEGQWNDESGVLVPVKCLIDLVPRKGSEFYKCLGDLKTTRSAALFPWQRHCFEMGYYVQAAYHRDLYVAATGEDRSDWCFLLQENYRPWQPAKRLLSQDFLDLGRAEYSRLLSNYCQSIKHGRWPGYDNHDEAVQGSWSICAPDPWMADKAAFAPRYEFGEQVEAENESEDVPT